MSAPTLILRSIIDAGVLDDDSDCYSISTYSQVAAENAAYVLIKDIEERGKKINIDKKKRAKFADEFLSVVLGFPVKDYAHIQTAIEVFKGWLADLSGFGNVKRQNKFARRFFRQLTQPFAFREANDRLTFENHFYGLLVTILEEYNEFALKYGTMMEVETWNTLFRCILMVTDSLISYDFSKILASAKQVEIRQKTITILYDISLTAGIISKEMWELFTRYSRKWSYCTDLLRVWSTFITKLTYMVFSRRLGFETEHKIEGGVYTGGKVIESKALEFIYQNFIFSIDQKLAMSTNVNILQYQMTIILLIKEFSEFANKKQNFFIPKFPNHVFLKMFGTAITDLPFTADESYDNGLSTALGTILMSTSFLEFPPNDVTRTKLLQIAVKLLEIGRPQLISSFFFYGYAAFSSWNDYLPLYSIKILKNIPKITAQKTPRFELDQLFNSTTSLFVNSSQIVSRFQPDDDSIITSFKWLFENSHINANRISLLSVCSSYPSIDIFQKISDIFSVSSIRALAHDDNVPYLCTLISLVGTFTRLNPQLLKNLTDMGLLASIVSAILSADCRKLSKGDHLITYTLLMLNSLIEYSNGVFSNKKNVNAFFELISFIQKNCSGKEKEKNASRRLIRKLAATVSARLNLHFPSAELFTNKSETTTGNEKDLIKKLGLTSVKYYHFTLCSSIFVTFMVKPDETGPIGIICRGPFGKCSWIISDIFKSGKEPKLSDELKEESHQDNPLEVPSSQFDSANLQSVVGIPDVSFNEYFKEDQKIYTNFKIMFNKWLSMDQYGFIDKFGEEKPYIRPRVCDFLLQTGILDTNNKLDVNIIGNSDELQSIKKTFDNLDILAKVPISIAHVTIGDNKPSTPRNTTKYSEFIRKIGNTISYKGKWVPTFQIAAGLAILTDGESKFPLQIIFNETNYDYTIPNLSKHVISISPLGNDLYKVIEKLPPFQGVSPFSGQFDLVLDISTLRTFITMCIDMSPRYLSKFDVFDIIQKRKEALKPLFKEKSKDLLAPKISLIAK